MTFSVYDFTETLAGEKIERTDINRVVAAWGEEGICSEWSGGFLLEMKSGKFLYITGWCDTTGWGCQDGTQKAEFDSLPDISTLERSAAGAWKNEKPEEWETTLPDLQKFIETGEGRW